MLSIRLLPQDEYRWLGDDNPSPHTFPREQGKYPLYHQWRTYHAETPLIVNTYNTGTGKTKAALLRLLRRAQQRGFQNLGPKDNALLISPTNALLAQHVEDAQGFCAENALPYRVVSLTREQIEAYVYVGEVQRRKATKLTSIINDPTSVDDDHTKRATLVVVNPDIFYYAIYFLYNANDRTSLFYDFFHSFNYVVIDELHYYTPKQLATFLFFIKLSQEYGYLESQSRKRQFCILTATPRPQVTRYLNNLELPIDWIQPGDQHIPPEHRALCEPVRALAPVRLEIYSLDELESDEQPGSLLRLVTQRCQDIKTWLTTTIDGYPMDGAIISDSLGMINRIRQSVLTAGISDHLLGRITGPEGQENRQEAKEKHLILTTPTVDIGYNFERARPKPRQSIDFLLIDAYTGDAFIQRLGRAGRVLAKAEDQKHHESIVIALVNAESYRQLQEYDQRELERSRLAEIAATLPAKNDLYAYIRTGAILELRHPLAHLGRSMPDAEHEQLLAFLHNLQMCFHDGRKPYTYDFVKNWFYIYESQQKYYAQLTSIPQNTFDYLRSVMEKRKPLEQVEPPASKQCVTAMRDRLKEVHRKVEWKHKNSNEIIEWVQNDIRAYVREKARLSFRESFQPPEALIYDPETLHSSETVSAYNALHLVTYYHIRFYESKDQWETETGQSAAKIDTTGVVLYGRVLRFRDTPLRLGLRLAARASSWGEWEEQHAHQVTALYGLEVVAVREDNGLPVGVLDMLQDWFVPAFIIRVGGRTDTELHYLRKQARFYPMSLTVTFHDGRQQSYYAILGTMAFLVCAEISPRAKASDRRKALRDDDSPIIC